LFTFLAHISILLFLILHEASQRFALPALGRAAGRRPTGKMLRRRKLLGIAPESPASGARFVGTLLTIKRPCYCKSCFIFSSSIGAFLSIEVAKDNKPDRVEIIDAIDNFFGCDF
jgi:hypothetical protein